AHTATVEELAKQALLSVSYFGRAFKVTFSDTPRAYLIQLRLERAKDLMLSTQEPLSQIALACGFADQAHLSRAFRRVMGETPAAWRRRNLTEAQAAASAPRCVNGSMVAPLPSTGVRPSAGRKIQAARIHELGPPRVISMETVGVPEPGAGEVLVRVHAA